MSDKKNGGEINKKPYIISAGGISIDLNKFGGNIELTQEEKKESKLSVEVGKKLYKKAKMLGMRNPHIFSGNLAEIYHNAREIDRHINKLLSLDVKNSHDREEFGDILVDINVTLGFIRLEIGEVRKALERVIDSCYKSSD